MCSILTSLLSLSDRVKWCNLIVKIANEGKSNLNLNSKKLVYLLSSEILIKNVQNNFDKKLREILK